MQDRDMLQDIVQMETSCLAVASQVKSIKGSLEDVLYLFC